MFINLVLPFRCFPFQTLSSISIYVYQPCSPFYSMASLSVLSIFILALIHPCLSYFPNVFLSFCVKFRCFSNNYPPAFFFRTFLSYALPTHFSLFSCFTHFPPIIFSYKKCFSPFRQFFPLFYDFLSFLSISCVTACLVNSLFDSHPPPQLFQR